VLYHVPDNFEKDGSEGDNGGNMAEDWRRNGGFVDEKKRKEVEDDLFKKYSLWIRTLRSRNSNPRRDESDTKKQNGEREKKRSEAGMWRKGQKRKKKNPREHLLGK